MKKTKKILSVLPVSIAGTLIIKAFSKGFEQNDAQVLSFDVRELQDKVVQKKIREFSPDALFCYDYGYLTDNSKTEFVRSLDIMLVHYFADEPRSKYADFNQEDLHSRLLGNEKIFCWDEKYLNDFLSPASYFPLCVDESLYGCDFSGYKYDITFIGRPLGDARQEILANIVKKYGNRLKIFSYPAHFEKSIENMSKRLNSTELEAYKKTFAGFIEDETQMAQIYSSSRVNLNINLQGEHSLNYRTYEVLASNGALLSDRAGEFQDYIEIYNDPCEVVKKIEFMLNNQKNIKKTTPLARYSLKIRAGKLLSEIFGVV